MTARRRYPNGLMLWELLMAMGLLSVVALLAGQIFIATNRTSFEIARRHTAQSAFDQAVRQLRRDVWDANSLRVQNSRLQIETANGKKIEWQADDSLRRTLNSGVRHWDELGGHLSIEVHGPTAVLRQEPSVNESGGELVLPSQVLLLKGGVR